MNLAKISGYCNTEAASWIFKFIILIGNIKNEDPLLLFFIYHKSKHDYAVFVLRKTK